MLESHFNNEPAALLKKRLWHRCLPVNFAKSSVEYLQMAACMFCYPLPVNISIYFNFLF